MRRLVTWAARQAATATLLATLATGAPAQTAQTATTDQSDLWWNAAESGWGMQIVEGGNAAFATLFVYDAAGQPTFFTATLTGDASASWSGDLYRTTGPFFAADPFDAGRVVARKVGSLNFARANADSGTLRYSVDGLAVSKSVVRQTLRNDNYTGSYEAVFSVVTTHCSNSADNRATTAAHPLGIAHNNTAMTLTGDFISRGSCTYAGTYIQSGKLGAVGAAYSCTGGDEGTMNFFELTRRPGMVSGRMQGHSISDSCDYAGTFTGLVPN